MQKLPAAFYATPDGSEPVREWLLRLEASDARTVARDIATAAFGWADGMPLCRPLGHGLWQIRSPISGGRMAVVIFAPAHGHMVLLHGFIGRAQRQPTQRDIELAAERLKEIL